MENIDPSRDPSIPSVSIVMAAHNEALKIGRALDSILAQTLTDWELIVIDDGSSDATADIVHQYGEQDGRVRLVCNESNLKLPASLNKGIKLAKSDLIARADADDINLPERLSRQYEHMQAHEEIDVLGTGAYLLDDTGQRVSTVSLPLTHAEHERMPFLKTHFFHPSVMIRKRFFDTAGLYDENYTRAQDRELWMRGLSVGCRYANLPEPLIEYGASGFSRSWRSTIDSKLSLLRLARKYKIRHGYLKVLLSFAHAAAINMHLYKPKSLRRQ